MPKIISSDAKPKPMRIPARENALEKLRNTTRLGYARINGNDDAPRSRRNQHRPHRPPTHRKLSELASQSLLTTPVFPRANSDCTEKLALHSAQPAPPARNNPAGNRS